MLRVSAIAVYSYQRSGETGWGMFRGYGETATAIVLPDPLE